MSGTIVTSIPLRYKTNEVRFYPLEENAIELANLAAGKTCKMALFYPNSSYDYAIPFCLEILYELNIRQKSRRGSLLLIGNRKVPLLREVYLDMFYGDGNFANQLFGLCSVGTKKTTSMKRPGIKKEAKDMFIFSSSYNSLPPESMLNEIGCCCIIAPAYGIDARIEDIVKQCELSGIGTVFILDFLPTAKKIKHYATLGFLLYGWSGDEVLDQAKKYAGQESGIPVSDPKSLVAAVSVRDQLEIVTVHNTEANRLLQGFSKIIDKLSRLAEPTSKENVLVKECRYILRKIEAQPSSLYDHDNADSPLEPPQIADKINFLISACESETFEFPAEVSELKSYMGDVRSFFYKNAPKLQVITSEILRSIKANEKAIVLFKSDEEKDAFEHSIENSAELNVEMLSQIKTTTFFCSTDEILDEYDSAIFTTYPPLSRSVVVSEIRAKSKKAILYPAERFKYDIYTGIRQQLDSSIFNQSMRDRIIKFLSGSGDAPIIPKIRPINVHLLDEVFSQQKEPEILPLLTEIEELSEADPIIDEDVMENARSDPEGPIRIDCILLTSSTGIRIFVPKKKMVEVLLENDKTRLKRAEELKEGDVLLLINRSVKQTLNHLILSKAEEYPKLRVLRNLVRIWVKELKSGMNANEDTEHSLLKKLQSLGSKIKNENTIKYWRRGYIIGPKDPENIARIAKIYSSETLSNNLHGVSRAIKLLRGLRMAILRKARIAMVEGETEEIEKLGVNISEFQQYLELFPIANTKEVKNTPLYNLNSAEGSYETA